MTDVTRLTRVVGFSVAGVRARGAARVSNNRPDGADGRQRTPATARNPPLVRIRQSLLKEEIIGFGTLEEFP